jgi:hypothetical protein
MSEAYTGGCACGAIRFEIAAEPLGQNHCQCRDCQRISGTGHGSYLGFSCAQMKLIGRPSQWDMTGDSGAVKTRAFCPACGMPLYITFSAAPDFLALHAASLDDPSRFRPQMVSYTVRGQDWDSLDSSLPTFERMPPASC